MQLRRSVLAIICILFTSCVSKNVGKGTRDDKARVAEAIEKSNDPKLIAYAESKDGQAYIQKVVQAVGSLNSREVAAVAGDIKTDRNRADGQVAVYQHGKDLQFIAAPNDTFNISSIEESAAAVDRLRKFLVETRDAFGISSKSSFQLRPVSALPAGPNTVAIRYQQIIQRKIVEASPYDINIEGAGLVARVESGRLIAINSNLENPPSLSFVWNKPGFNLSGLSTKEFDTLLHLTLTADQSQKTGQALARIAASSGQIFNIQEFRNLNPADQKAQLTQLFSKLGPDTTFKLLIGLARQKRLGLVNYAGHWMFRVTHFLDLPILFDIEIPDTSTTQLLVKNLRLDVHDVGINIYEVNSVPAALFTPIFIAGDESSPLDISRAGGRTAQVFQTILKNYEDRLGWFNYTGHNPSGLLSVNIGVTDPKWIENAFWSSWQSTIYVGAGGSTLANLDVSTGVLAHEFTHAVVGATAGLVYEGEAGALNEHIADALGTLVDSDVNNGGRYTYAIGADVVTAPAASTQRALLPLILKAVGVTDDQISAYHLDVVALRHMYIPALSLSSSIGSYDQVPAEYHAGCQPSENNDQCGVHSVSGVPNRAVANIISKIGPEKARKLVFQTLSRRLTSRPTLIEYATQSYAECLASPQDFDAATDCPVVADSFAQVGLPVSGTQTPNNDAALTFCGDRVVAPSGNVTIQDGAVNPVILVAKYPKLTQGEFKLVYTVPRVCVKGTLGEQANSKGVVFKYFVQVLEAKADNGSGGSQPAPAPAPQDNGLTYCGPTQVAKSRNVVIADQKFNPVILVAKYPILTKGQFNAVYGMTCACVRGHLSQQANSAGVKFNYFTDVSQLSACH